MIAAQRAEQMPESMQYTIDRLAENGAMFVMSVEEAAKDVRAWDRLRKQLRSELTAVICKAEVK